MASNVSIATKPLVYSTFRHISNKVWNALSEYIDNSIQSFEDHRDELAKINRDGKLHVSIVIDFERDIITIIDDAYGITSQNYQRAFELANIPLDNKGLNEFGMGMKVSSIWLSNIWTVETSAYGEPVSKTMTFNLKEVVENNEMELPVDEKPCSLADHYTKITLSSLSMNKPSPRQLSYIKDHIASIYTKYLREDSIEISINDEILKYEDLKVLNAPHYSNSNGPSILWRKDISFGPIPMGDKVYSVKGFIAVLETMSTSQNNGFLLFRRGRAIGTSFDERYRPKTLCGQEGSPQYKRVFGELYIEGFDVSFTKSSFQEDDDFEMFIQLLKDDLVKDKSFDLFGQAQNYIKPKSQKEITNMGTNLAKQIAKGFTKPIVNIPKPNQQPIQPSLSPAVETQNPTQELDIFGNPLSSSDGYNIPAITVPVKLDNGASVSLTIVCEKGNTSAGLYSLKTNPSDGYTTVINLNNPIFDRFDKLLSSSTSDGIEFLAYIIQVMVASEISISAGGDQVGCFFRNKFNELIGAI